MRAYVAHPEGKPRAGLLVFQEAFGVNAHIRDVTERFAREGYLSISPELFHRTAPGLEAGYTNFPEVMPHMQALTDAGLAADIQACVSVAQERRGEGLAGGRHRILHGRTDFDSGGAHRSAPVRGLLLRRRHRARRHVPEPGDRLKDLKAPTLFFWGGLDAHIGPDAVQAVTSALSAAKKDYVNVVFSNADHGFFCDARASYNAVAAKQAWSLTLEFFNLHLAGAAKKADA